MVGMDSFRKEVKAYTLFETLVVVILLSLIIFFGVNLFGKVNEWYANYLSVSKGRIESSSLYTHMKWDVQMANDVEATANGFVLFHYPNQEVQYENNQDEIVRIALDGSIRYLLKGEVVLNKQKIYCMDENEELIFVIKLPVHVEVK